MAQVKAFFDDIRGIDGVEGILLLDPEGRTLYGEFQTKAVEKAGEASGKSLTAAMADLKEAELVYENNRIYIKRVDDRWLLVFMTASAPVAMVRINCNIIVPNLAETLNRPRGLGRFFKRKPR